MNVVPLPILRKRAGKIHSIQDSLIKGRLISMGIFKGKHIQIIRSSLFEGAFYVKVDDQVFGLRKEELAQILVV